MIVIAFLVGLCSAVDLQALIGNMTVEELVGQMTQLDISVFGKLDDQGIFQIDEDAVKTAMETYKIGSILNSPYAGAAGPDGSQAGLSPLEWQNLTNYLQNVAINSGTKIPIVYGLDSVHGANYVKGATIFPQQINMAASFNTTAVGLAGAVSAKDTRACGVHWAFSPILGLTMQPQWARVYETFGEDPHLVSEMGAAIIIGMQGGNPPKLNLTNTVAACMKHFIGYSNPRAGLDRAPTWVPERHLYQYMVPPFRAAVNAGVATTMEAYTDLNGIPMVANGNKLVTLLRQDLGFEGVLVTDYSEINNLHYWHKVSPSVKDAVHMAIGDTSIDMSMVPLDYSFNQYLVELVNEGEITRKRLEASAMRVLVLKQQLGLLDGGYAPADPALTKSVGSQVDQDLSLAVSRESIVLASNQNAVLPLPTNKNAKLFLTGPTADSISSLCGGWTIHWQGATDKEYWMGKSFYQALQDYTNEKSTTWQTSFRAAVPFDGQADPNEVSQAITEATASDYIIACLGEPAYAEKPGDIRDIQLPAVQQDYLRQLIATGKPVILIMLQGRPRVMDPDLWNGVSAVLIAGLPGPFGGVALSEILAGATNPSARMPYSYPQFPNHLHAPYWAPNTTGAQPIWGFGHGLSYTTFSYSHLMLNTTTLDANSTSVLVSVSVTNSGPVDGQEVVTLYLIDQYRSVTPEARLLKRFQKVFLAKGETTKVTFVLSVEDTMFVGRYSNNLMMESGNFTVSVGGQFVDFELFAELVLEIEVLKECSDVMDEVGLVSIGGVAGIAFSALAVGASGMAWYLTSSRSARNSFQTIP